MENRAWRNKVVLLKIEMHDLFRRWGPRKMKLPVLGET